MTKSHETWYAIVNPDAGSGKTLSLWREAETILYEKGVKYKFTSPESPSDSNKRIKEACSQGYRKFIAVGGDGTIHQLLKSIAEYVEETANGLKLSDFTLAVLPIGSGNDWIRSHNIPRNHKDIIELIAAGSFAPQDVVKADLVAPNSAKVIKTAYMANVGGYNFDANVCDVVNFQKANGVTGKLMYVNALKRIALTQKPARTKIICDGEVVYDDMLYSISIGNGKYSGGGLCQTPSARPDDGILDMMVVPIFPLWKVFFNIKKLLECRTEEIPFLKFFRAKAIDIVPYGQGQLVEIDGDIIGRAPVHLEIMPDQLNVLDRKQKAE